MELLWTDIPAAAFKRILRKLACHDRANATATCRRWRYLTHSLLCPTKASANLQQQLPALPFWCHDSIECIEITVREPASALHGPPDHFGPTDASELTRDFVHLGLTNMNKVAGDSLVHITSTESSLISQDTAMEGVPSEPKTLYTGDRTLSLVLPGYIAQEALLFNAFNSCGGLLDLWNKIEIRFMPHKQLDHAKPAPLLLTEGDVSLHHLCPNLDHPFLHCFMIMDGSLSQYLTVCELSSGFSKDAYHTEYGTHQLQPQQSTQQLEFPVLQELCLCIAEDVHMLEHAGPETDLQQSMKVIEASAWNDLLQNSKFPVLTTLKMHTHRHLVFVRPECITHMQSLRHLIVTGEGVVLSTPSQLLSQHAKYAFDPTGCLQQVPNLQTLRVDGVCYDYTEYDLQSCSIMHDRLQISFDSLPPTLTALSVGMSLSAIKTSSCLLSNCHSLRLLVLQIKDVSCAADEIVDLRQLLSGSTVQHVILHMPPATCHLKIVADKPECVSCTSDSSKLHQALARSAAAACPHGMS